MTQELQQNNKNHPIFKAVVFAAQAHAGQYRKGTRIPYLIHPLGVMKTLLEHGASDEAAIAGVLHDTIEDTDTTPEQIEKAFGKKVLELVQAATEPHRNEPWEKRKEHTIAFLKTANEEICMVSCADKLDNIKSIKNDLATIGEDVWTKFNRPKEKQAWYYQALAEAFNRKDLTNKLFKIFREEVKQVFGE
ncbi:bifunctional (p)ppGpp synthetase/guanosine-3',5'-bis(diphosphate) 3'-pyrophosphohydrolase [Candidatus Woesearchaeota archaeon]|nr:bifunctional (p)ppGpp synthetase/guanosine-3',5'-bis(diphosphate) 3'-pyrophosphohydrolase [Candidatus Woesearchaeota archaeon]